MLDAISHFNSILDDWGHKVIYRRYNVGTRSTHYDKATREGVGGERWTHTDECRVCRTSSTSSRGVKGTYEGTVLYYFKTGVLPKVGDVIIEVNGSNSPSTSDTAVLQSSHQLAMRIKDVEPKRGANGELVFYTCYARPEYGHY